MQRKLAANGRKQKPKIVSNDCPRGERERARPRR